MIKFSNKGIKFSELTLDIELNLSVVVNQLLPWIFLYTLIHYEFHQILYSASIK